jgi:ABC transporter substrate binding protein
MRSPSRTFPWREKYQESVVNVKIVVIVMSDPNHHNVWPQSSHRHLLIAEAQHPGKGPRIGVLSTRVKPTPTNPDLFENAFRQGLRDLGYSDGKNILVEYRYAKGVEERLLGFAAELVRLKVDVLVFAAISGIRAAKQATKTIRIVMMITGDPVALGLIDPNPDFEGAFQVATNGRVSALIVDTGGLTISYRKLIADLALKHRIPSMCERSDYVEAGCLMS